MTTSSIFVEMLITVSTMRQSVFRGQALTGKDFFLQCLFAVVVTAMLAQLAYMALMTNCHGLLYIGIINSIELVLSSARVTSAKFQPKSVR